MILYCIVWFVLTVINVFKLDPTQAAICIFCEVLMAFNLYSYYRCSKVQKENIKKLALQYGTGVAGNFMRGSIIANYLS